MQVPTNLLGIPLPKMPDVVGEHSEVVRYPMLLAEVHDDRQADPRRGVPGAWGVCGGRPRHHRGPVDDL